jgi:hypothetical protein
MTVTEQRAAVKGHPSMVVSRPSGQREGDYDLREIALWILDNPERADYRLSDWWQAPLTRNSPPPFEDANGTPTYFLGFEFELAAYRLIAHACRGEVYAPDDLALVIRGGAPL